MAKPRLILDNAAIDLIISRFALQIMEDQASDEVVAIVGLQPRGVEFSRRIFARVKEFFPENNLLYGELDITFHRDDVGRGEQILVPKETYLRFSTENIKIILVDDVLYTGRTPKFCTTPQLAFQGNLLARYRAPTNFRALRPT